ncbi:MAG: NAD-dependent epimerase/dehydratase family protein [Methanoregulaceae archaeon]|nr:NAD-dependent epimerase/dehydratase family protein [Methanoregulaceae archaeon]
MNVLVTGATGLLGANIVRELESRGDAVRALVRPSSDLRGLEGTRVAKVPGHILDRESLRGAVKGCDAVIHAAAHTGQWPTDYRHYEQVNVTGTELVMDACRIAGIRRIIYVSTANAFGYGSKEHPGTELSEFNGFRSGSGYIISKYLAQQNVLTQVEKHGLPVVIVNPTFMIGPYDTRPSSGKIILMGLNKRWQFFPGGGKNFIHVRDAATAICNALDRGTPGACYLLAGENLTYREFFAKLNRVTGDRPVKIGFPACLLNTAGVVGTWMEKMTGKPAPLNLVNSRLLGTGYYYSGRKAVKELGMPQTPVEEAILEALGWFRSRWSGVLADQRPEITRKVRGKDPAVTLSR